MRKILIYTRYKKNLKKLPVQAVVLRSKFPSSNTIWVRKRGVSDNMTEVDTYFPAAYRRVEDISQCRCSNRNHSTRPSKYMAKKEVYISLAWAVSESRCFLVYPTPCRHRNPMTLSKKFFFFMNMAWKTTHATGSLGSQLNAGTQSHDDGPNGEQGEWREIHKLVKHQTFF